MYTDKNNKTFSYVFYNHLHSGFKYSLTCTFVQHWREVFLKPNITSTITARCVRMVLKSKIDT